MTPKTVCFYSLSYPFSRSQLQTRSGPCWQTPPSSCLPGSLPPLALPHGCSSSASTALNSKHVWCAQVALFQLQRSSCLRFPGPWPQSGGECDYVSRKLAFFQNTQVWVCSSWTSSFLRAPSPPALWECHLLLLLQSQQPHLEGIAPLSLTRALVCTLENVNF